MKITASNWHRTSFPGLGAAQGGVGKQATDTGRSKENAESKGLKSLRETLDQLKAAMSPKQRAKKAAADKIGMLQQRLMQLKQMLLHASPEQAKALARELKSIAGELAAAAKGAASASGGGQGISVPSPVVSGTEGAASASAPSEAETASAASSNPAPQDSEGAAAEAKQETRGAVADQADKDGAAGEKRPDGSSDSIEMSDKALKDMLKEAKKLLKEAIDLLKAKMGHGDKASRKDVEEAEKKLLEIGLTSDTDFSAASAYTSQGLGSLEGGSMEGAAAGSNVSVKA